MPIARGHVFLRRKIMMFRNKKPVRKVKRTGFVFFRIVYLEFEYHFAVLGFFRGDEILDCLNAGHRSGAGVRRHKH